MAGTVANYFKKFTNTTRDITDLELINLSRVMLTVDTWEEFRDWISGAGSLIRVHHLGKLWDEGYIVGFLGKPESEEALKGEDPGVFLLRFSDFGSVQGPGINIDYSTGNEVETIVLTADDLETENLPERIQGRDFLHYVYSGISSPTSGKKGLTEKEIAFPTTPYAADGGDDESGITMEALDSSDLLSAEMMEEFKTEFESFLKEVLVELKAE